MTALVGSVIQGFFVHGRPHLGKLSAAARVPRHSAHHQGQPSEKTASGAMRQLPGGEAYFLRSDQLRLGAMPGQPLPAQLRQTMETVFGTSFADVRVHVGAQPGALGARAFTHGSNLYFTPGQYSPETPNGQRLLAHELAHVVQQRCGRVRNPWGTGVAVVQDRLLETQANQMAARAALHASFGPPAPVGAPVDGRPSAGRTIQRMEEQIHRIDYFRYDSEGRVMHSLNRKKELHFMKTTKNPGQTGSVGKYVYHMTSLYNLVNIRQVGLDPARGGKSGGSCEQCDKPTLKQTSIKNSRNRIAVAVDRLTLGTYINQREDMAEDPWQQGRAGNHSVLLRFKVKASHQGFRNKQRTFSSTWSKDPDDKRAWHLTGIPILPTELEVLVETGWVPLTLVCLNTLRLSIGLDHAPFNDDYSPEVSDTYTTLRPLVDPPMSKPRPRPKPNSRRCLLL